MSTHPAYAAGDLLSCGHTIYDSTDGMVFWAALPGVMGGTACFDDAVLTEHCGGVATIIPTPGQSADDAYWHAAGIGMD